MKKFVLLFIYVFLMLPVFAQTNFQELSLEKALEKAKGEGKMVFIDCYTSWCGPCKIMAKGILLLKEVGDFLNERFVCVKYDMEKGEGKELSKQFKIRAYPTFLLLNPEGKETYRVVGGGELQEFILRVKRRWMP